MNEVVGILGSEDTSSLTSFMVLAYIKVMENGECFSTPRMKKGKGVCEIKEASQEERRYSGIVGRTNGISVPVSHITGVA